MKKKLVYFLVLIFNLLALSYLIAPTPILKDLPHSKKSDLPGDTIQIPNTSAYFTNLSRTEVINFYQASYNGLFRIRLNHPPETAKTIWQETTPSYYLEEFILPFKETLYINGFEWEKDVFTQPDKRIKNKIIYNDKEYQAKITIRTFPVPLSHRLIVFFASEIFIIFALVQYQKFLKHRG